MAASVNILGSGSRVRAFSKSKNSCKNRAKLRLKIGRVFVQFRNRFCTNFCVLRLLRPLWISLQPLQTTWQPLWPSSEVRAISKRKNLYKIDCGRVSKKTNCFYILNNLHDFLRSFYGVMVSTLCFWTTCPGFDSRLGRANFLFLLMIWLSEFMISVSSSWQERSKSKDCKSCSWDDSSEKSAALADCSFSLLGRGPPIANPKRLNLWTPVS